MIDKCSCDEALLYREILNKLGWKVNNTGKVTGKDWNEIVLPELEKLNNER